jgi:hypothetical protein
VGRGFATRGACVKATPCRRCSFCSLWKLFNALIRKADNWSLLQPLRITKMLHQTVVYADDMVVFIHPATSDLGLIRGIFTLFEGASRLACNIAKCHMVKTKSSLPPPCFPCQVVDLLMTYLGMPLSVAKIPNTALYALVDRMANQLPAWKGRLMHRSGRLALIKSSLAAMPVYSVINIELPPWLLKAFERIIKAFLWMGTNEVIGRKCLVAWNQVQRPLQLGGLGVPDFRLRW